jgi:hypothetical protein
VQESVAQTVAAMSTQGAVVQPAGGYSPQPVATTEIPTPMTPPINTPAPVIHVIMPGEMQAIESTIDDVKFNGDDFSTNLFERPLTPKEMQDRFDLDLQTITLSTDNTFLYFSLDLRDVNLNTKALDGNYGIELDTDQDGRGDYLLWAFIPPSSTSWTIDGMALFNDMNNDVGSTRPLLSDPVAQTDGYDTEVWPSKPMLDPDGAWVRINPNDATVVQLAVKRSLIDNPAKFLWSAWADDQIKTPIKFDYNDAYTEAQAGSLVSSSPYYPIQEIALVDNTCREAWGFLPTRKEPGICKPAVVVQPTATKKPVAGPTKTKAPDQPTPTPTLKPVITVPVCTDVQVGAQVTPWDVAYTSGVTLCLNGDCKNPDSLGYALWYLPAGTYTILASAPAYGISPTSATTTLGCGEKSLSQFQIGPP